MTWRRLFRWIRNYLVGLVIVWVFAVCFCAWVSTLLDQQAFSLDSGPVLSWVLWVPLIPAIPWPLWVIPLSYLMEVPVLEMRFFDDFVVCRRIFSRLSNDQEKGDVAKRDSNKND